MSGRITIIMMFQFLYSKEVLHSTPKYINTQNYTYFDINWDQFLKLQKKPSLLNRFALLCIREGKKLESTSEYVLFKLKYSINYIFKKYIKSSTVVL